MAQTIKLKRSASQGAAPSTSNLELGEVAINTYDGKMYIKKDVGGTESIVEIGGGSTVSYLEAGMIEYEYTATSNQTTFSGSDTNSATLSYTANSIMVFLNGVLQDDGVDYTATNGTSVVFSSALTANDEVRIVAFTNVTTSGSLQDPTKLDAITTVNAQAAYSLTLNSSAYIPSSQNALIVSLNGITQEPGDSFTISGSTITFSPALVTGDVVDYIVDMGRAVTIGEYSGDLAVGGELEVTGDIIGDIRGAILFKAQAGETLAKGDVVYISGISGNTTVVSKADADDSAKMPAFGVAAAAASSSTTVDIYTFGTLSGLDTSSFSEGDELFVSTTAGTLTNSAPTGESAQIQKIAQVTRSDNSAGSIKIMGPGRSNATPNLDDGDIFIGNASNQAVTASLNTKIEDYLDGGTSTPVFSTVNSGNITTTGYIAGPSTFTIDPAAVGDNTGTLVVAGNLQVDGTTTTINSTTMTVDDLNITLASGAANAAAANGAGITVDGASATLTYNGTNDDWNFNKNLNTGKINATVDSNIAAAFSSTTTTAKITLADANDQAFIDINASRIGIGHSSSTSLQALQIEPTSAEAMRIDSSGRVGIGTASPDADLEIRKDNASGLGAVLSLTNSNSSGLTGNSVAIGLSAYAHTTIDSASYRGAIIRSKTTAAGNGHSIIFETSDTSLVPAERMIIDHNGNVGIGTTPTQRLDVREEKTGGGVLVQVYNTDNSDTTTQTAGLALGPDSRGGTTRITAVKENADFSTNAGRDVALTFSSVLNNTPTEYMRISSAGNIGIGTDTPAQLLDVGDHDVAGNRSIRISQRTGTNTTTYGGLEFFYNNTAGTTAVNAAIYYAAGSQRNYGELAFHTGNAGTTTERVRIERTGNVGIGTPTPESLLHLVGGSATKILIEDSSNLRGNYIGIEDSDNVIIAADEDQAGASSSIRFRVDADEKMRINSLGDVGIGTNPNHNLHIHQADSGGAWLQFTNSTTGTTTADGAIVGLDSAEEFNIRVYENKPIDFWTNNTHQIRITDSGELHLYKGILDLTDLEDPALPVSIESTGTLGNGGSYDSSLKDDGQLQYNAASHLFADTSSVVNGYPSAWYEIDGGFRWGLSSTEVLTVNSSGNVQVDISGARSGLSSLSITSNPFTIGSLTDFNVAFDTNEIQARNNGAANNLILNKNGGTVGIGTTNTTYVLEIEAAGDNGIRMASTSSHASLFLDSASGFGQYLRFTENGSNNWWINATASSNGYLQFRPEASATPILQLGHDYKITTNGSDTVGDASYYHFSITNNQTGSDALTADRTHTSLYINTDNSQSGGDTADEIRSYGVYADTRITADADLCVGVLGYSRSDKSSGTTTNVRGGQFQALGHDSAGGIVSNIQGVYASASHYQVETTPVVTAGSFLSQATGTGDGNITNFEGVRAETQVDSGYAGTISTGFTFRAMHDNNNGSTHTHNTHYLYYGDYTGTLPTTARGLWINDNVPSRFSGDLHVNGTLTKTSGSFQISHPLPSMANTHDLVHSFVESPQPDNIYSGMVTLVDGSATINIDTAAGMTEGTFVLLNKNIRRTVTNEEGFTAIKSSLSGNILTITAQDNTCTDEVFWMVIGQRNDAEIRALHTTDSEGNLIVEPEKGPEWERPDRSEETTTTYDPENPFPDQE